VGAIFRRGPFSLLSPPVIRLLNNVYAALSILIVEERYNSAAPPLSVPPYCPLTESAAFLFLPLRCSANNAIFFFGRFHLHMSFAKRFLTPFLCHRQALFPFILHWQGTSERLFFSPPCEFLPFSGFPLLYPRRCGIFVLLLLSSFFSGPKIILPSFPSAFPPASKQRRTSSFPPLL